MRFVPLALSGLVFACAPIPHTDGGVVAPAPRAQATSGPPGTTVAADVVAVNRPGEMVDVAAVVVPGKVTVVSFGAAWCSACKNLERRLAGVAGVQPNVAVRKVDVGNIGTPVANRYGANPLPHVLIYDSGGRLYKAMTGSASRTAPELVYELARRRDG